MTALKHNSWAYENEVRFIHAQVRQEPQGAFRQVAEFSDLSPVYWEEPLHRLRSGNTVDYKKFPYGRRENRISDPSRAIASVVLGPRCELTEDQARSLFSSNGFQNFEVEKSDCQIR
jgi:hypothetical protein